MKKNYLKILLCFALCMFMALTMLPAQEAKASTELTCVKGHSGDCVSIMSIVDDECHYLYCTECEKTPGGYYQQAVHHTYTIRDGKAICTLSGCDHECEHSSQTNEICDYCGMVLHTHTYETKKNIEFSWDKDKVDNLAIEIMVTGTVECDICSYTYSRAATLPLEIIKDSTCTESGTGRYRIKKMPPPISVPFELKVEIPIDKDAHKWETTYTSDATGHWHACSLCEATKDQAEHTWSNGKCTVCNYECTHTGQTGATCTVCGATLCEHQWGDYIADGANGHYRVCTKCEAKSSTESHEHDKFKPDGDNGHYETCPKCGEKLSELRQHYFGDPTYTWDEEYKTCKAEQFCYSCKYTKVTSGTVSTEVKTAATCKEAGLKVVTATFESPLTTQTKEVVIPVDENAHTWDEGKITKAATCAAKGEKTYTCKNDSSHTKTEEIAIDKDAHSWDDGKVTKEATCTEAGEKVYTCRNDETHTRTEVIPAGGGHKLTATPAKEATCTEDGNSAYWTCSDCKKYFSDAEGKTEIQEGSWVIKAHHPADKIVTDDAVLPTCEKTGLTAGSHCEECGAVIVAQEVIEPLGHNFMGWHTDNAGNHTNRCITCRLEKTVPCSMTALPGHEGISFCPICGYCEGEGAAMESAIGYLEKYDGVKTGVPRYYTLNVKGEKYLIISFENNGQETRTEGEFTFTLPEEMVKGFSFRQIGADGTEIPVEITESYGYYRITLDFTPEGKEPVQVMILKIVGL